MVWKRSGLVFLLQVQGMRALRPGRAQIVHSKGPKRYRRGTMRELLHGEQCQIELPAMQMQGLRLLPQMQSMVQLANRLRFKGVCDVFPLRGPRIGRATPMRDVV